ncbi:hypothetical protein F5J12DRAFT_947888 [Pisolithus orientalis]|uniref:uncharacterized protein n=1 Tax=Pisolithus orientalis TaxID=936130 RepID=UPI00222547C3|nr:uncharacterized protein F5J12DRAFT_947888 [Pisolithus orientalis]KAI6002407.1 hypothetical protein F5J12DRAFT_947888 [Pisolithus orientalis]
MPKSAQCHTMKKMHKAQGPPAENAECDMLCSPSSFIAVPNGDEAGPSIYSFDDEKFKTEFHPHSNQPLLCQSFDDNYGVGNFEFMEIALEASLNWKQANTLLDLIGHVAKGAAWVTLKNDVKFQKACDAAAAELTLHDGHGFECFHDEPWTGNSWWDIQSSLPEVLNAVPFSFIIYTNKTKLSLFGTAKGYPVVVCCVNLPVEIQNSHTIGGGCIIGWLPVPKDAEEEGKLGYITLKCIVWHKSFSRLLSDIMQHSKTGYIHMSHHDQVTCWLFPVILILSADYKEQCMMLLIHGHTGKCPCPVCLIPLGELHNISKTYPLHSMDEAQCAMHIYRHSHTEGEKVLKALGLQPIDNVFWLICNSDLYGALSFDHLHFLHGGLWGKHILWDILRILNVLGCNAETNVENYKSGLVFIPCAYYSMLQAMFYALLNVFTRTAIPKGYCLLHILTSYLQLDSLIGLDMHTEQTIEMIDAELLKFDNELKAYIECVNKSGLEELWVAWDFPKVHLWKHVAHDIQMKGATRNYSMHLNESMHGPIKEAYECIILHVDEHKLSAKLLRMCVDNYKNWTQMQGEPAGTEGECNNDQSGSFMAFGHVYLGSSSKSSTVQDTEASCSVSDIAFITEYRYLKVNYKSSVDWKVVTDHLQCNLSFYGQPQYDCTLIQLMGTETAFFHLISIFTCDVPVDIDLWLICIKAAPHNNPIFIPIQSILCGAVVAPDPSCPSKFFVVNHIDGDMSLGMKSQT